MSRQVAEYRSHAYKRMFERPLGSAIATSVCLLLLRQRLSATKAAGFPTLPLTLPELAHWPVLAFPCFAWACCWLAGWLAS